MLKGDKIAIVGDLHGRYNGFDNEFLETQGFDLALFVGDLGSGSLNNGLHVIRTISRLRVPGLLIPGNNDSPHLAQLKAELAFQSGKSELFRLMGPSTRRGVEPCGLSAHDLITQDGPVTLIAARPCAMGGSECSFPEQLDRNHQISSLEQSEIKLKALVSAAPHRDLIFLAHNGPLGLGAESNDLWGRDFELPGMPDAPKDWGDSDLSAAISHAEQLGKRVIAVIAGHMHRSPHRGRPLVQWKNEVAYVNAAATPRIRTVGGGEEHHFVELTLDLKAALPLQVSERWVRSSGGQNEGE